MSDKYIQSSVEHAIAYTVGKDIIRVPGVTDEPNGVAVTEEQSAILEKQSVFAANLTSGKYKILDEVPASAKTVREQFTALNEQLSSKDAEIAELKAKFGVE